MVQILLYFCAVEKVSIQVAGEEMVLLAQKCMYWPHTHTLIISDLHLGKSNHFRKSGIPLSIGSAMADLERMSLLISSLSPMRLVFLGDLFHSDHNAEWELLAGWIRQYPQIHFELVEGNHDLLPVDVYHQAGIQVRSGITLHGIHLSHEPADEPGTYNICGHIHPGVRLVGKAKQSLRIPCFYISSMRMVLPAFGSLTGLYIIEPKAQEMVYGVADSSLIQLKLPIK